MSTYGEAAKLADDFANDICKNETNVKFISGAAGAVVGGTVTAVTGNPALGIAAGGAVGGFAKSHSETVAKIGATVVTTVAISAGSVLFAMALPIVGAGWLVKKALDL